MVLYDMMTVVYSTAVYITFFYQDVSTLVFISKTIKNLMSNKAIVS